MALNARQMCSFYLVCLTSEHDRTPKLVAQCHFHLHFQLLFLFHTFLLTGCFCREPVSSALELVTPKARLGVLDKKRCSPDHELPPGFAIVRTGHLGPSPGLRACKPAPEWRVATCPHTGCLRREQDPAPYLLCTQSPLFLRIYG